MVVAMTTIQIDCAACKAPRGSCDDCVVAAMLDVEGPPSLSVDEQAALRALSQARLVPPLRLVADGVMQTDDRQWVAA